MNVEFVQGAGPSEWFSGQRYLFNLIHEKYTEPKCLERLRLSFLRDGYIPLPELIAPSALNALRRELEQLNKLGKDRSFTMPGYETPRVLRTLGGQRIIKTCPQLFSLYVHHEIHELVMGLAGKQIFPCQHPEEFMVANFLNQPGATHGWHLDDPPYALVLFFDAPQPQDGGLLEFVPDWHAFCREHGLDPKVNVENSVMLAREQNLVQVRHHRRGDGYLLKADACLHRVTELAREGAKRAVLNLAYQDRDNMPYEGTATLLYAQ